nr:phosphonate C-P lyase system protein PhnH [uncultured Cohaesibacter sp.]
MAEVTPCGIAPEEKLDAMIGGLGDPVFQTQRLFRSIMDAMARPGTIHALKTDAQPPASIYPLTAAVLATLADADTPIWLEGRLSGNLTLTSWLTFHIGAPFATEPDGASFAVLKGGKEMPALDVFAKGTQDYPDRSATLIIEVEALSDMPKWFLSGPGIKEQNGLMVSDLAPLFLSQWQDNQGIFPRGVDIIFVSREAIACLPRTTNISLAPPNASDKQEL